MTGWVCVARFGGIGDNLISASVLRPLKRLGYKVEMMTDIKYGVVYQNNPFIDKLTVLPEGHIPPGPNWNEWFEKRAKEYDGFWHLSHTCEGRHALNTGTAAFWWPAAYRRKLCAGSYLETVHDIVGVAHDFGPLFFPEEEEFERGRKTKAEVGGRYLVWVIAGSRIDKVHPYSGMVVARIIRELDIAVMMIGAGGVQFEHAKTIAEHVKRQNGTDKGLHLALSPDTSDPGGHQHWGVRRSLTQALLADCVVTPDTGFAWATAMEPMPKVVLVSHASAENITSHWKNTITLHADPNEVPCWSCHRLHDTIATCTPARDLGIAAACMADISTELIVSAVKAALTRDATLLDAWPTRVTLRDFPSRPPLRVVANA
jgi:ADP-heptose:LPS heptosyltransferase